MMNREEEAAATVKQGSSSSNPNGRNRKRKAVLTVPLKLEGMKLEGEETDDYRPPNFLQRIFAILKDIRPGTDLMHFPVPPIFNIPKSMHQVYGEAVYCISKDLLSQCANGMSPVDRFLSVVAWNISALRPVRFGVSPYNPILGETHHVSRGTLNVLVEQVSHHPPVTALHGTDEKNGIEVIWCHHVVPKFNGASVDSTFNGKRELRLLNRGENYVAIIPNLVIRFLPVHGNYWSGKSKIYCQETGLEAELSFGGSSFLGRRASQRSIKGKILMASSRKTIYEVNGHWDSDVTVKDVRNGNLTVIYDAPTVLSGLKTPLVKDQEGLQPTESAVVWAELSENILSKSWDKAKEAKTAVEERERELVRERKAKGETWVPKHFTVSHSKEGGWTCVPNQRLVPPAPIVVPF